MPQLHPIGNVDGAEFRGDVVFVHGLDGSASSTWTTGHPAEQTWLGWIGVGRTTLPPADDTWPAWLGGDLPQVAVWALDYEVKSSGWRGWTMPLSDRAVSVSETLAKSRIGARPVVFVCHSLGGLLVKKLLAQCRTSHNPEYREIARKTCGVAFLATPHVGSRLANFVLRIPFYRATEAVVNLSYGDAPLGELNDWYRRFARVKKIKHKVYRETRSIRGLRVVDSVSGDPGLDDATAIPLDNHHIEVTKPPGRWEDQYKGVKDLVCDCFDLPRTVHPPPPPPPPRTPRPRGRRVAGAVAMPLVLAAAGYAIVSQWPASRGGGLPGGGPVAPVQMPDSIRSKLPHHDEASCRLFDSRFREAKRTEVSTRAAFVTFKNLTNKDLMAWRSLHTCAKPPRVEEAQGPADQTKGAPIGEGDSPPATALDFRDEPQGLPIGPKAEKELGAIQPGYQFFMFSDPATGKEYTPHPDWEYLKPGRTYEVAVSPAMFKAGGEPDGFIGYRFR